MINLVERARSHGVRTAVISDGSMRSYEELLEDSAAIASFLLGGRSNLHEERIAFLVPAGYDYVKVQWGIWRAGGIAVPLCEKHPLPSMQYVLEDTGASMVIHDPEFSDFLVPLRNASTASFFETNKLQATSSDLPDVDPSVRAMILYTSGTTGKPKGVVSTHNNIEAQIRALVKAWEWSPDDHILNILPLHHVHGIVNVTLCALWSGACCEFLPKFDTADVFGCFNRGEINVFMAVPTIYYKLINYWENLPDDEKAIISNSLGRFRLMVSGSAALPVSVLEKWREISGHTLLERYGMTEMGMAISNPYRGERRPGHIGQPLPGVEVQLRDEDGNIVNRGEPGEIHVKGDNVFREYWEKPGPTMEAFTPDGWFRTGDIAVVDNGYYRILGRNSVDIIKSGGYKISALEIEEVMRKHKAVAECAVVGVPDPEWGEIVAAGVIPVPGSTIDAEDLRKWLSSQLPKYQLPRKYMILEALPRNVMGKVTKKAVTALFT